MKRLILMKVVKTTFVEVPELGERIKQAREADRRSLRKICEAVGMTPANWYRIEREEQALPIETLRKIEKELKVDFNVEMT